MKIRVPEYFTSFRCIADKCRDSCCIGWEIDIDEATRAKYTRIDGEIGREIAEKTSHGYFPLLENGRCAFLDESGLCRIISAIGDGYLCDICREHPRYYGVGADGLEGGLGLGCEEAARMILELAKKPKILQIDREVRYVDSDDYAALSDQLRERLYEDIFSCDIRSLIGEYVEYARIADDAAFEITTTGEPTPLAHPECVTADAEKMSRIYGNMISLLAECDALTDEWCEAVNKIKSIDPASLIDTLDSMRGILYYFTHRYVREGVEDLSLGQRVLFALASSLAVAALSSIQVGSDAQVLAAVSYSKNIEYSTDNVEYILENIDIL